MANVLSTLNDHVRRLARREVSAELRRTRKLAAHHRRDIAALKRQVGDLSQAVQFLTRQEQRRAATPSLPTNGSGEKMRFRADGLRSHRKRLGLSAADYGRLVGVSALTIYNWELGKARPRRAQLLKLASVRGIGKREASKRLELLSH